MHTQRGHVDYLVTFKRAAYVCIVKRNQPHLHKQPVVCGLGTCWTGCSRYIVDMISSWVCVVRRP
jgi:hypothetical protein